MAWQAYENNKKQKLDGMTICALILILSLGV
jgi:hypothetical protein